MVILIIRVSHLDEREVVEVKKQLPLANPTQVNKSQELGTYIYHDFSKWTIEINSYLDNTKSLSDLLIISKPADLHYGDLLSCFEWKYKRLTVLFRDNYECNDCKKRGKSNHVHHEYYVQDKLPWEIDNEGLITLCRTCHALRHQKMMIPVFRFSGNNKILVSKENPSCSRCGGTGYFHEYKHIENGVCFKCRGNLISRNVFEYMLIEVYNNLNSYNDNRQRDEYRDFLKQISSSDFLEKVPDAKDYNIEIDLPF